MSYIYNLFARIRCCLAASCRGAGAQQRRRRLVLLPRSDGRGRCCI